jgi:UPF0755 protein
VLKFLHKISIVVFVFLLFFAAGLGLWSWHALNHQNPQQKTVRVLKGSSLKKVAAQLAEEKIVRDKTFFELFVRFGKRGKTLRAGEYDIPVNSKLTEIVDQMIEGRVKLYKLTIPEGYTTGDICALLIKKGLSTGEECTQQTGRVDLLKDAPPAANLEGYLFPETYLYEYDATPSSLVEQMTNEFYRRVDSNRVEKARANELTLFDVVILASVVEKETGKADERPLIAGVFRNRLKLGMPLQSDPTVIYGIKDFNGNLTRKDLETDSPYNTYTRTGLPKGPICNPGLEAIDAVLSPAPTEYLYFVAKGDGSHYFSKTLEEHNEAVKKYQLSIFNGQ